MNNNDKLTIIHFITQMDDISTDLESIIYSIKQKQITKKELKNVLKQIVKLHKIKIKKFNSFIKNCFNDSTY